MEVPLWGTILLDPVRTRLRPSTMVLHGLTHKVGSSTRPASSMLTQLNVSFWRVPLRKTGESTCFQTVILRELTKGSLDFFHCFFNIDSIINNVLHLSCAIQLKRSLTYCHTGKKHEIVPQFRFGPENDPILVHFSRKKFQNCPTTRFSTVPYEGVSKFSIQ